MARKTFLSVFGWMGGRKINGGAFVFSHRAHQKVFSPKWRENWKRKSSYLINKNAHVQFLSFFFPFFFFFGARDVASFSFSFSFSFFPFFFLFFPLHVAFSFFNFLGKGWHDASFFFFSLIFPGGCLFFFFFFFLGGLWMW